MWKTIVRKIIRIVLFILFLFIATPYFGKAQANIEKPCKNILIINSYHEGFAWTDEENAGIIDRLHESCFNFNIMTEYMDWKNYNTEENLNYLYDYYKFKYETKDIDIIIVTDDIALEFALDYREEIFANTPIVFCGVNNKGFQDIVADRKMVTGVIEVIDPTKTIEIAMDLNPSLRQIYLVYDNNESGQSTGQMVTEKINSMNRDLEIIPMNDMVFDDIISSVQELTEESIILITTYYSDASHHILDLEYITREISGNSSVPVYHLYDFGIRNGSLGGVTLSGRLQGEYAADIAIQIFEGANIEDIPIMILENSRIVFNYDQMVRFGISINDIPESSIIINRPFSFYETYKYLVHMVGTVIAFLIIFVFILLIYIKRIKRMKKNLADSHEELTQIYEELAASDEEMREQYDEMLMINEKIIKGEEQLSYLAYHDTLTGLANKLSLYDYANTIFRVDKGKAALLFIDIDNFKYVNDTLGHALGDLLIIKVSERIVSLLEDNCTVYRLSGDEFILLLEEVDSTEAVEQFANKILSNFTDTFELKDSTLHISLSIGVVMYPEHGNNLEELLKYADIAMYRVKEAGRKNYIVYDHPMNTIFTERVDIEKYLHTALENNEFEVYYQPQFHSRTKKMAGLEALLRWRNPVLGFVPPLKFIHIAEDTRDIIKIGTWVLQKSCEFLRNLIDLGHKDLTVSVNISMLQLLQPDFCDIVAQALDEYHISPQLLELEITETTLMESFEAILPKLDQLSKMQVSLALDDFGKGYSSLNYLKQLPINTLKVDKSFIDPITDPERDTLAGQIVMLGKSMGMCVIAEGVERVEQVEYLVRFNCDKIQGYLYSKPITTKEVIKLLQV